MRWHLIRHAATAHAPGTLIGRTDAALSAAGAAAAAALARTWCYPRPTRIVASDRVRALATAEPLARRFGCPIARSPAWRELDFGAWEGRSYAALERSDGEALRQWLTHWRERGPPGGESYATLSRRVRRWLDRNADRADSDELVIVAHAGSVRAALAALLRIDDAVAQAQALPYGAHWVLVRRAGGWSVEAASGEPFGPGNASLPSFTAVSSGAEP